MEKISIKPTSSVYATFERYSYKVESALSEFLDNATASYYENRQNLVEYAKKRNRNYKFQIFVIYDKSKGAKRESIQISDNAAGMNLEELDDALHFGRVENKKNSRSEFGMGMKTAAIWFSNKWEVETKKYGAPNSLKVSFDVEKVRLEQTELLDVIETVSIPSAHFTTINLIDLKRKLTITNQKKMLKRFASIYRRDILNGDLELRFAIKDIDKNGNIIIKDFNEIIKDDLIDIEPLEYVKPKIKEFTHENLPKISATEEIQSNFDLTGSFIYDGEEYHVKGFAASLETASTIGAGLTLFRRDRVIVGGYENNYRPYEIFGPSNSFPFQRIFGEVDMDSFPVNQSKDGLSWDGGLQEAFVEYLQLKMKKLVRYTSIYRLNAPIDESVVNSNQIIRDAEKNISEKFKIPVSLDERTQIEYIASEKSFSNNDKSSATTSKDKWKINGTDYVINFLVLKAADKISDWVKIIQKDSDYEFDVTINLDHAFFKPFVENKYAIAHIVKFSKLYSIILINGQLHKLTAGEFSRQFNFVMSLDNYSVDDYITEKYTIEKENENEQ